MQGSTSRSRADADLERMECAPSQWPARRCGSARASRGTEVPATFEKSACRLFRCRRIGVRVGKYPLPTAQQGLLDHRGGLQSQAQRSRPARTRSIGQFALRSRPAKVGHRIRLHSAARVPFLKWGRPAGCCSDTPCKYCRRLKPRPRCTKPCLRKARQSHVKSQPGAGRALHS